MIPLLGSTHQGLVVRLMGGVRLGATIGAVVGGVV
jgi:hypothetical protein